MTKVKKNEVTEQTTTVDTVEEALKIQESLDAAGDSSALSNEERNSIQAEISDELAAMAGSAETLSIPDTDKAMPEATATNSQVSEAKTMAKEIGTMVAGSSAMIFGRDYGVNDAAIDKWADSMAPLLVKYGVTDMNDLMEKWGPEIQAGVGCMALGIGIMATKRKYKLEDAANAKAQKEEAANNGNQPQ